MRLFRAAMLGMAISIATQGGCRSTQGPQPSGPVIPRGPAPGYEQVAAAYNVRVQTLERLWARTVVRLKFVNADGKEQNEQVEGFCQFVRPSKVLVSFQKMGQPVALLGANEEKFWWIELGDKKRAFVGTHANATPKRISAAGLRVHPLDLMELMAITPMPGPAPGGMLDGVVGRRAALLVTIPGRMNVRKLRLDPVTYRPFRIELVGEDGRIAASSDLAKYEGIALKGARPGAVRPYVPTDVRVEADGGATRVIMQLSDAQDDPGRFRSEIIFDLAGLMEANGVQQVENLDEAGREPVNR